MNQVTLTASGFPRLIHQIWLNFSGDPLLNDRPPPAKYSKTMGSWISNPRWVRCVWGDSGSRAFLRQFFPLFAARWERYKQPVLKVDSLRFFLLLHYGGIYSDTDVECLCDLDWFADMYLSDPRLAFFARGDTESPTNFLFGAVPEHPLILKICRALYLTPDSPWNLARSGIAPLILTGPLFVQNQIGAHKEYSKKFYGSVSDTILLPAWSVRVRHRPKTPHQLFDHRGNTEWVTGPGIVWDCVRGVALLGICILLIWALCRPRRS